MIGLLILALNVAVIAGAPGRCILPPTPSKLHELFEAPKVDDLSRCALSPDSQSRQIVQNPQVVSVLLLENSAFYSQRCVGTIINRNSILTAASCIQIYREHQVRVRVGSSLANSGGVVHAVASMRVPGPGLCSSPAVYRLNDVGVIRTASEIVYVNNVVEPATFAGIYDVPVGDRVTTFGFGTDPMGNDRFPELRQQSQRVISLEQCSSHHYTIPEIICSIADIMVCSATGNRIQDIGSPIYHNGVVVGVASYIANPGLPVVNTRISSFIDWIRAVA